MKKPLTGALRLIDANLNRAREGMRVVEDTLRFLYGDRTGCRALKRLRHSLDAAARRIYPELLRSRDSTGDVGRGVRETPHPDAKAILFANFNRAKESVRSLEEYSRLIDPAASAAFKRIRFGLYGLEKKIGLRYFAKKD